MINNAKILTLILSFSLITLVKSEYFCRNKFKIHNIGTTDTPTINLYVMHKNWFNENTSLIIDLFIQIDCFFNIDDNNIYSRFVVIGDKWYDTKIYKNKAELISFMLKWKNLTNYDSINYSFESFCDNFMYQINRISDSIGKHHFQYSAKNFIFFNDKPPTYASYKFCKQKYLNEIQRYVPNTIGAFFNFIYPSDAHNSLHAYHLITKDQFINDQRIYPGILFEYSKTKGYTSIYRFALAIDNQSTSFSSMYNQFSKNTNYVHLNNDYFQMKLPSYLTQGAKIKLDVIEGIIVFFLLILLMILVFCSCVCAAASAGAVQEDIEDRRHNQRLAELLDSNNNENSTVITSQHESIEIHQTELEIERSNGECGAIRVTSNQSIISVMTAIPSTPLNNNESINDSGYHTDL